MTAWSGALSFHNLSINYGMNFWHDSRSKPCQLALILIDTKANFLGLPPPWQPNPTYEITMYLQRYQHF